MRDEAAMDKVLEWAVRYAEADVYFRAMYRDGYEWNGPEWDEARSRRKEAKRALVSWAIRYRDSNEKAPGVAGG